MSGIEDTQIISAAEVAAELANGNGTPPTSLIAELRQRRAELAEEQTLELLIPGYGGKLALRLGPINGATQSALLERLAKSKDRERDFNLNADYLVAACREIVGRERWEDPWTPLGELAQTEGTIKLDDRLVELLQLEPASRTAREVLRALYSGAPSAEVAITLAGGEYVQWAGAANVEVDEVFAGES